MLTKKEKFLIIYYHKPVLAWFLPLQIQRSGNKRHEAREAVWVFWENSRKDSTIETRFRRYRRRLYSAVHLLRKAPTDVPHTKRISPTVDDLWECQLCHLSLRGSQQLHRRRNQAISFQTTLLRCPLFGSCPLCSLQCLQHCHFWHLPAWGCVTDSVKLY